MAAYLRRTNQDLERTAEAAAPARDDLVMHFLLRRGHLDWADLSVTGHLQLPGAAAWGHGSDNRIVRQDPGLSNEFTSRLGFGSNLGLRSAWRERPVSAQGRHLTYNSAAVGYFCPALSASRSTRKRSRQADNSATPRPAVSAVMPAARRCFNSEVNVGLPSRRPALAEPKACVLPRSIRRVLERPNLAPCEQGDKNFLSRQSRNQTGRHRQRTQKRLGRTGNFG